MVKVNYVWEERRNAKVLKKIFEAETEDFRSEEGVMYIAKPRSEKKKGGVYYRVDVAVDYPFEYIVLPITLWEKIVEYMDWLEAVKSLAGKLCVALDIEYDLRLKALAEVLHEELSRLKSLRCDEEPTEERRLACIARRESLDLSAKYIETMIAYYQKEKEKFEKLCREWVFTSKPPFED